MHMGSMVTIGKYAKNYKYIFLNNLAHESVGGQKTLIETLNLKISLKPLDLKII